MRDALRLTVPNGKAREIKVYLKTIGRNVILRRGTSDLWCLQNVFLDQEYDTPFPVDPKVIIDGGANIGMTTLFFSDKYPRAQIIAIEPEVSNFAILEKNCGALPHVNLINAALWPTEQALAIKDSTAEKWAFSVTGGINESDEEAVKSVTIPEIFRRFGISHIDILKLDVEGAERELFRNGAEAWLGSVGQIIIELHDLLVSGCAHAFYGKIARHQFVQDIQGKNIFVSFRALK